MSTLFEEPNNRLRYRGIRTTPNHPHSNGLIESFHRHLKSSLKAHNQIQWAESLSIVLPGLSTTLKNDIQFITAELAYVTNIGLPCNPINSEIVYKPVTITYVTELIETIGALNLIATAMHCNSKT